MNGITSAAKANRSTRNGELPAFQMCSFAAQDSKADSKIPSGDSYIMTTVNEGKTWTDPEEMMGSDMLARWPKGKG